MLPRSIRQSSGRLLCMCEKTTSQRFELASDGLGTSEDPACFVELARFVQTSALLEQAAELAHSLEMEAEELLDIGRRH